MDVYMYQAALYCEDCGERIKRKLDRAGKAPEDSSDEYSFDSDNYPKGPYPDGGGEADGPQHCDSMEKCVNAEHLRWHGRPVGKTGAFLENELTSEGLQYLCEMISESGASDYQKALHKLWINYYRQHGYKQEIASCVREEMRR